MKVKTDVKAGQLNDYSTFLTAPNTQDELGADDLEAMLQLLLEGPLGSSSPPPP